MKLKLAILSKLSALTAKKGTLLVCLLAAVFASLGAGIIYASTAIGGSHGPSSSSSSGPPPTPEQFLRRFIANLGGLNMFFEYLQGFSGNNAIITGGNPNAGAGWSLVDTFGPKLPWHPGFNKGGPPNGGESEPPDTLGSYTNLFQGYSGYNPFFTPSSGGGGGGGDGDGDFKVLGDGEGNPNPPAVPVPAPVLLLGSGLIGFFFIRRKRSSLALR